MLPKTNLTIKEGAFNKGRTDAFTEMITTNIVFPSYDWIRNKPYIIIEDHSINVDSVYLPYSIKEIYANSIKANNIKCQIFENEKPESWTDGWYYSDSTFTPGVEWGVING